MTYFDQMKRSILLIQTSIVARMINIILDFLRYSGIVFHFSRTCEKVLSSFSQIFEKKNNTKNLEF